MQEGAIDPEPPARSTVGPLKSGHCRTRVQRKRKRPGRIAAPAADCAGSRKEYCQRHILNLDRRAARLPSSLVLPPVAHHGAGGASPALSNRVVTRWSYPDKVINCKRSAPSAPKSV